VYSLGSDDKRFKHLYLEAATMRVGESKFTEHAIEDDTEYPLGEKTETFTIVYANIDLCGNVVVKDDLTVENDLTVDGNVAILGDSNSTFDVCSNEIVLNADEVDVCGNLTVNGKIELSGDVCIFGDELMLDASHIDICGNLDVEGSLTVYGDEITLDASQVDICGNLDVEGDLDVQGTLKVNGVEVTGSSGGSSGGSSVLQTRTFTLSLNDQELFLDKPDGYICTQLTFKETDPIQLGSSMGHLSGRGLKILVDNESNASYGAGSPALVDGILCYTKNDSGTYNNGPISVTSDGTRIGIASGYANVGESGDESFFKNSNGTFFDPTGDVYMKLATSNGVSAGAITGAGAVGEISFTAIFSPITE
jgi:phage baseplate assembly protein gpV